MSQATADEGPNFLLEWPSRWQEFRTAISPALQRSGARLAGEAHGGLFPYKGMLSSIALEILFIVLIIVVPPKLANLAPTVLQTRAKYDVIYFSGEELPRTEDLGGAETGVSGKAGGQEAFHKTQSIRVARGRTTSDRVVDAPTLKLPHSNAEVANLLAYAAVPGPPPSEGLKASPRSLELPMSLVAPPPEVQRDRLKAAPSLTQDVVAPTQDSPQRDRLPGAPSMESRVIAPAPNLSPRDIPAMQVPGSRQPQVVAPPVSAPERFSDRQARLSLPASAVVAPAPQVNREIASGPGYGAGEFRPQIVPPPVQMSGGATQRNGGRGMGSSMEVVPPPAQVGGSVTGRQGSHGLGGAVGVVPPPVEVGGGSFGQHPASSLGGGSNVVPPAPSVAGGVAGGLGSGNRGSGRGGVGDLGDAAAPPNSGGSGTAKGVVVSRLPGSEVGIPGGGPGALAMSPAGGSNPGMGGSGGGSGIGSGSDSGSGFTGTGPGAGKTGVGRGSEVNAKGGTSPYPGPGGAGSATSGTPAVPGVSVRGGNSIVKLPSFSDGASSPTELGRSSAGKDKQGPGITIVASARSGGALAYYGGLKGDKVYTIYIDTILGPAVLQFADPSSAAHPYAEDLTSPQPVRADLPSGLAHSRLVIACMLDKTGTLKNVQVLEPGSAVMTSKVLAALPRWKFQPAMRGGKPVEVNAILGFNIDTNDQY